MAFKAVSAHLREPDDYELATYRLMQQLKEENVLHAEVYVAVGVCLFRKQDFAAIFEGLERGRARGARGFRGFTVVDFRCNPAFRRGRGTKRFRTGGALPGSARGRRGHRR